MKNKDKNVAVVRIDNLKGCGSSAVSQRIKAVVKYVGGLLASRRVFLLVTVRSFLFLVDQLRRKHPFKHANKKNSRGLLHCTNNL